VLGSVLALSGSDQSRSQRSPWSGTSVGLMIRLKKKRKNIINYKTDMRRLNTLLAVK